MRRSSKKLIQDVVRTKRGSKVLTQFHSANCDPELYPMMLVPSYQTDESLSKVYLFFIVFKIMFGPYYIEISSCFIKSHVLCDLDLLIKFSLAAMEIFLKLLPSGVS